MKLDRNVNPDGKGKYALINLRTNQVQWGGYDQFFVIKYKDEFAAPALRAYAQAAFDRADAIQKQSDEELANVDRDYSTARAISNMERLSKKAASLREFALEMFEEAKKAEQWPDKKIPD